MKINPFIRKVNFYETDQMGIVHHSNYIRWFEEARIDFLEKSGFSYEKVMSTGAHFMVLSINCDYKKPTTFGDTIEIYVNAKILSHVKMALEYKILRGGELCTVGESVHCCYDDINKKVVSIKKMLPRFYDLFS